MPEKHFPMPVRWEARKGGRSAWISVGYPDKGRHFQCDYLGDMTQGPKHRSDFASEPPEWVIEALGL